METCMPRLGEKFPDMQVQTTRGVLKLSDAYHGKWFILFSHPADFTPVCTTEFVALQHRLEDFQAVNCEVIGLSVDQVFAHIAWLEWIKEHLATPITFPVIADDGGRVAQMLGLLHPAKGTNTVRAVLIVDAKGMIRAILFYPQELGRNIDELLRMVKGLQLADKEGVALPANWPTNELIQERVIIPPAMDVNTAEERKTAFDGFDWWFCHKKV